MKNLRPDLQSVQEGDRCIVRWIRRAAIGKVRRRSPGGRFTVAVAGTLILFNPAGRQVGSRGWDNPELHPWNDDEGRQIQDDLERERIAGRLRHEVEWAKLSLEVLRQVDALTRAPEGSKQ